MTTTPRPISSATSTQDLLKLLTKSQKEPLSILKFLKEAQRSPDSSDITQSTQILEAELQSYKEYFSKLRFQYLEQVTKERFLNAITAEVPDLVEPEEIEVLQIKVAKQKAQLKECKSQVDGIHTQLTRLGKQICEEYERIKSSSTKLSTLPASISELEAEVAELLSLQPNDPDPDLNLPLRETLSKLQSADSEILQLQRQIDAANRSINSKQRKLDGLEKELKPLEANKEAVSANAEENLRRREEERMRGLANRENVGKWYKREEEVLSGL